MQGWAMVMMLVSLLSLRAASAELSLLTPDPCADDLVTWEVTGALPAWQGFDVSKAPVLHITSPSGKIWIRSAFLDQAFTKAPAGPDGSPEYAAAGERSLHVRHTPRVPGVHQWVLKDPTGADLARGQLAVKPSRGPYPVGMLQISKDNPRLLAFRDGTIFIPIGPNVCWANGPDRLVNFERYLSRLADAGGNHIRLWCASWCGQIEGDEPDSYRLDQAWVLDRILAMARAKKLRVTVCLDNFHDLGHGKKFPYGATYTARLSGFMAPTPPAQYERRLRYVLARWGADDTIASWELFNEIDLAQPVRDDTVAWVQGAAALLARLDADNRLRTVSWHGDDWDSVVGLPNLDLVQIHSYVLEWVDPLGLRKMVTRDGVGMLLNNAERANASGHPFCFSEVGYQGTNEKNPGHALDTGGLLLRQQAWSGFLLGGYGSGMNWWWDVYLDTANLWGSYRGMAKILPQLDWRDREMSPLTPNVDSALRIVGWQSPRQALFWPQLRADTWYNALMDQKPRPQLKKVVQIRLGGMRASHHFAVHYLDLITGDEREKREAISTAQGVLEVSVVPPDVDTVLWIDGR